MFIQNSISLPVRFVLLGHARSGSNLVMRSLMDHPAVAMLGEALSDSEEVRFGIWDASKNASVYRTGENAAEFLHHSVFLQEGSESIRAAGFKLFYEQSRGGPEMQSGWDYLLAGREIRIIHLRRRNLLECYLSLEVAVKTGQWLRLAGPQARRPQAPEALLEATPEDLHAYFDRILTWQLWAEQAFSGHAVLELEYERDVCADLQGTADRIFQFVGVEKFPVQARLLKQRTLSAEQQLTNFAEARRYFRHTLFEKYFG